MLVWQLLHWTSRSGGAAASSCRLRVVPLWQVEQLVSVAAWAKRAAGPAGEAADSRLGVAGGAVRPLVATWPAYDAVPSAPLVPSPVYAAVVTGVAAAGAHRRVVHRVGGEARCRVGVAVAALDVPVGMCGGVVMPVAVVPLWQVEQLVSVAAWAKRAAGPAGEAAGSALAWQVAQSGRWSRRGPAYEAVPMRALGALAGVRTVVAGVAAAGADRRVVHRVGGEARRRVGVAVAALDARSPGCAAASSCRSPSCRCGRSSSWCRSPRGRSVPPAQLAKLRQRWRGR